MTGVLERLEEELRLNTNEMARQQDYTMKLRALLEGADAAFQWLAANHPKAMRELPTPLYIKLKEAQVALIALQEEKA